MHFKVYSRYFYSKLDEKSKSVYNKILQGWLDLNTKIVLMGSYDDIDLVKVIFSVYDDNPELFYINLRTLSVGLGISHAEIKVKFRYTNDEIERLKERMYNIVSDFKLQNKNVDDKERAIHDFLAKNVVYLSDTVAPSGHNIYGPLISKAAVCEGFARAFKLLCDEMQIPCIIVVGTAQTDSGDSERHAWNMVFVNNEKYHIDVTWNSSAARTDSPYLYYNVSEDFIKKNHIWDIEKWPRCLVPGDSEKNMINSESFESLCKSLKEELNKERKHIVIRSFKKFNSLEEASELISKAFTNINAQIYAYSLSYQEKLDCISLSVEYTK